MRVLSFKVFYDVYTYQGQQHHELHSATVSRHRSWMLPNFDSAVRTRRNHLSIFGGMVLHPKYDLIVGSRRRIRWQGGRLRSE